MSQIFLISEFIAYKYIWLFLHLEISLDQNVICCYVIGKLFHNERDAPKIPKDHALKSEVKLNRNKTVRTDIILRDAGTIDNFAIDKITGIRNKIYRMT